MLPGMMYVVVFGVALTLTILATPLSMRLGQRWQLVDKPGGRRQHHGVISRVGGIALFTGFMSASLLIVALSFAGVWTPLTGEEQKLLAGVLLGSAVVFGFGLWDDSKELGAWTQFGAQFVAACIAIGFDVFVERVTLPIIGYTVFPLWITYPLTVFWVMGMINTVNWLDGLDGLAAGVAAVAGLLFAMHSYYLGQTMVAAFPLALAAACLGFLWFNFHPARIFMGSSGSMLLGYALATLSILAPAKLATALLVLGLPIIDVAWLILHRWRQRGNPMAAGRDHLHYRLLDLGLSQRQIVLLYYAFCAAFGILAIVISDRFLKLMVLTGMGLATLTLLWRLAERDKVLD